MPRPEPTRISRRRWLKAAAGGATLAAGSVAYAWRIEPHWVRVTHVPMTFASLPDGLVGKRLVQLSDLHVGPVVDNGYLRRVLRRLEDLRPDWVAVTGDFMTSRHAEEVPLTIETLRDSPVADLPTIATLGNHDYGHLFTDRAVADRLSDSLDAMGVRVLRNESAVVGGLQFAASDDLWAGRCHVYNALSRVDLQQPTVFLAHNPDIADVRGWTTFGGWILSGHTHGGQCRLPLLGPPVLPVSNRAYAAGHVRLSGGRNLYVNRGLGYKHRLRFGVRPEITMFTLTRV